MKRWAVRCAAVLLAGTVMAAPVPPGACSVCFRFFDEGEVPLLAMDQVEQTERAICPRCAARPELCFLCALPTREDRKTLSDGRFYCARDAARARFDAGEIRRLGRELVDRMQRPWGRFMTLPKERIEWDVEDVSQRARALAEGQARCRHPALRLEARMEPDGSPRYTLVLLNGLPEAWLLSAAAHGLAHVWLLEQVPNARKLTRLTVEGFCDWIAWHTLTALGEKAEAERVRSADLGQGQLEVFLEADPIYGMFRVLEWVRFGEEDRLVSGDTDRVRRLDERLRPVQREPQQIIPPTPAPVRAPEVLVLRSVLGTGTRRLVLINNLTLALGEEGSARVGTNVVRVKCAEIGDDWVAVEVDGAPERQVLQLDN